MPLLDHFHAPLYPARRWESFHAFWSAAIAGNLNESVLPPIYYAETQTHFGGRVEVDVATLEKANRPVPTGNGPVAISVAEEVWAPPGPDLVIPAVFPDEFEVQVFGSSTGAHLVAAIELVSPGNKDRPEMRRAFASKCFGYLQLGVGLVVVDVVTARLANLHDELMRLMDQPDLASSPGESHLSAVSYQPARREAGDQVDGWVRPLAVGRPLPTLPLALRGGPTLPLDLELTYMEARRLGRL